uniref:Uncharacterized protein n=1 Tax=Gasterosteus aculeatus TaxID=69293 RepID=G3NBU0_GASAC
KKKRKELKAQTNTAEWNTVLKGSDFRYCCEEKRPPLITNHLEFSARLLDPSWDHFPPHAGKQLTDAFYFLCNTKTGCGATMIDSCAEP